MPRLLPVLLTVAALLAVGGGPAHGQARPNVVVIMTDDQTLADLETMPATRRLVGDAGATFNRSYVSYPLCCPSRATFLTGRYAHNHNVRSTVPPTGGVEALDAASTLPVWLQRAGYDTAHVGKYLNGYGLRRRPTVPPGWTDWHGAVDKSTYQMWGYSLFENGLLNSYGTFASEDPALYQTDVLRDKAVVVIEEHGPGRDPDPFFLSLAFLAPHGEVVRPGSLTRPHVRPAPRHRGRFATLAPTAPAYDELDVGDKPAFVRGLPRIGPTQAARIVTDFQARRESLLAVDEAVEAVVEALRRAQRLESTYILFTSDNGFFQGEHRIAKGKYLAYDASSRVPLLVRGPGIAPGTVSDELVANVDLAPTVLAATGAQPDEEIDGRSLLPFAQDPLRLTSRPILHEGLIAGDTDRDGDADPRRSRVATYAAIRTRRYLFVRWRGGERELYDLARDPFELDSLHRDPRYAGVRQALSGEVARLRGCVAIQCRDGIPGIRPVPRRRAVPRVGSGASEKLR